MAWEITYDKWLNHEQLSRQEKEQLKNMTMNEAEDAFYQALTFGTAGMRGKMGLGTNRMNKYIVRQATQGLVELLKEKHTQAKVVIAYDSRHHSADFAKEAARTLATAGIHVYLFESLRATPELSFAVRHLHAQAGIMMTASHNPPAYNGYKVYNALGGQLLPEAAEKLLQNMQKITDPLQIKVQDFASLKHSGIVEMIGETVGSAYLAELKQITRAKEVVAEKGKTLNIIYTPLHGVGEMIATRALKQAGFTQVQVVEAQADEDPNFSTVDSPNPEKTAAFSLAIEQAQAAAADIVVATDPDADRIGVAVRQPNNEYLLLTGNQLAALLVDYILSTQTDRQELTSASRLVTTIVSSTLPEHIGQYYGVKTDYVLTGFKYIAETIERYEKTGKQFAFGFEESMGYLVAPFVRDKDAFQTMLVVGELALQLKEQGKTLIDHLNGLYDKYGYFLEKTIDHTFSGAQGSEKIKMLLTAIRNKLPNTIAGQKVTVAEDYLTQERIAQGQTEKITGFPVADVLRFKLHDGSWLAIRPSGTEPKIKFYIGIRAKNSAIAANELQQLEAVVKDWLSAV